jgi:hypothetical protein
VSDAISTIMRRRTPAQEAGDVQQPAEPVCDETPISFRDEMDARQT